MQHLRKYFLENHLERKLRFKVESAFVMKYRYQVLVGEVGLKISELIRQTSHAFEIEILKGVVSKDHVHLFVSMPQICR